MGEKTKRVKEEMSGLSREDGIAIENLKRNIEKKKEMISRQRDYKVADNLEDLLFTTMDIKDEYLSYGPSVLVKDLTTECLIVKGLTVLQLKILEDVEIEAHVHKPQSQTLYVNEGKIVDLISKITFNAGTSFFAPANNQHKIKYLKGAMVTIVYLPNLEIIKENS